MPSWPSYRPFPYWPLMLDSGLGGNLSSRVLYEPGSHCLGLSACSAPRLGITSSYRLQGRLPGAGQCGTDFGGIAVLGFHRPLRFARRRS